MAGDPDKVKELFQESLELPPEQRGAFLDGSCGDDRELRAKVDTLLHAFDAAGSFLTEGEGRAGVSGEVAGTVIDRYKLLQEIGEGGFGVVWMAEQTAPVRRKVALKVIKLGMDTRQVVARFEAERQALAMMEHPSIAKVLDAGATSSGRPYFVMELVRGVPITKYCDQARQSPRERIRLFLRVCHAAQHAHQKGVIHRDLKPSNVLVTLQDGVAVPKVIDFGIAKATAQELTQKTLFTELKQMVGTPEYMAPEQAEMSGLDVDTRADVYSLGVMLYELLTGTRPFEMSPDRGYVELLRHVVEVEPSKPSTRIGTLGEQSYVANIYAAEAALRDHDSESARRHLEATAAGLRGWEWHYLYGRVDRSLWTAAAPGAVATALAFHPTEPAVASGWSDGIVRVNRIDGGALLGSHGHVDTPISALAFTVEGETLYIGDRSGGLTALDWSVGREVPLAGHAGAIRALAVSRDGSVLASASADGSLKLWETGTQQPLVTLPRDNAAHFIAWSPQGRALAVAYADHTVEILDAEPGGLVRVIAVLADGNHDTALGSVGALAFDREGHWLATGCGDGSFTIWDARSGSPVFRDAAHKGPIRDLDWAPDGTRLAVASEDRTISIWDTGDWRRAETLLGHSDDVREVTFHPRGEVLATVSGDRSVKLWRAGDGALRGTVLGHGEGILQAGFSIDDEGKHLATASADGTLKMWETHTPFMDSIHAQDDPVRSLSFATHDLLATSDQRGPVRIWNLQTVDQRIEPIYHPPGIASLAIYANAFMLATAAAELPANGGRDFGIRLWDLRSENPIRTLTGHLGEVRDLEFTADGARLASASADRTVRVWRVDTGAELLRLQGHEDAVTDLAFASQERIVSTSRDGSARIWHGMTGEQLRSIRFDSAVNAVAVRPDGRRVAFGCENRTIYLHDLETGARLGSLLGHGGAVTALAWLHDGSRVVSGSEDRTVRLWDPVSGENVATLLGHTREVRTVAVSGNGDTIASGSEDNVVRLWHRPGK